MRTALIFFAFWTLPLLTFGQDKDDITYRLLHDIRKRFDIMYMTASADSLTFRDTVARREFVNGAKKFLSDKNIELMLENINAFTWDESRLKKVQILTVDSLLKINSSSKKSRNIFHVSAPVFDETKQYAVVRMFQQFPDDYQFFGGGCVYLFHFSGRKWIDVLREDCKDY